MKSFSKMNKKDKFSVPKAGGNNLLRRRQNSKRNVSQMFLDAVTTLRLNEKITSKKICDFITKNYNLDLKKNVRHLKMLTRSNSTYDAYTFKQKPKISASKGNINISRKEDKSTSIEEAPIVSNTIDTGSLLENDSTNAVATQTLNNRAHDTVIHPTVEMLMRTDISQVHNPIITNKFMPDEKLITSFNKTSDKQEKRETRTKPLTKVGERKSSKNMIRNPSSETLQNGIYGQPPAHENDIPAEGFERKCSEKKQPRKKRRKTSIENDSCKLENVALPKRMKPSGKTTGITTQKISKEIGKSPGHSLTKEQITNSSVGNKSPATEQVDQELGSSRRKGRNKNTNAKQRKENRFSSPQNIQVNVDTKKTNKKRYIKKKIDENSNQAVEPSRKSRGRNASRVSGTKAALSVVPQTPKRQSKRISSQRHMNQHLHDSKNEPVHSDANKHSRRRSSNENISVYSPQSRDDTGDSNTLPCPITNEERNEFPEEMDQNEKVRRNSTKRKSARGQTSSDTVAMKSRHQKISNTKPESQGIRRDSTLRQTSRGCRPTNDAVRGSRTQEIPDSKSDGEKIRRNSTIRKSSDGRSPSDNATKGRRLDEMQESKKETERNRRNSSVRKSSDNKTESVRSRKDSTVRKASQGQSPPRTERNRSICPETPPRESEIEVVGRVSDGKMSSQRKSPSNEKRSKHKDMQGRKPENKISRKPPRKTKLPKKVYGTKFERENNHGASEENFNISPNNHILENINSVRVGKSDDALQMETETTKQLNQRNEMSSKRDAEGNVSCKGSKRTVEAGYLKSKRKASVSDKRSRSESKTKKGIGHFETAKRSRVRPKSKQEHSIKRIRKLKQIKEVPNSKQSFRKGHKSQRSTNKKRSVRK